MLRFRVNNWKKFTRKNVEIHEPRNVLFKKKEAIFTEPKCSQIYKRVEKPSEKYRITLNISTETC